MLIDAALQGDLAHVAADSAAHERSGRAGVWCSETGHDAFLSSLRAIDATASITVGTAVVIAFGRSPMTVASSAYDLAGASDGRFVLGLGTQVKSHVERRYSMPWSKPAARMREYVLALKAIWATWQDGVPLSFEGDFYSHTLMTPFFSPDPIEAGPPPVLLAAVGELMTKVAGEVADGLLVHAFTTPSYFASVTRPVLHEAGALNRSFCVSGTPFITVGRDEQELEAALIATRERIAFYASTPAYLAVLEHHGLAALGPELTALSKQGQWQEMGRRVPDELLNAISIVGNPAEVGRELHRRWSGLIDRATPYSALPLPLEVLDEVSTAAGLAS